MKKSYVAIIVTVVTVAIVLAIFPTPRLYTRQDLVKTLDCSQTIQDGYYISVGWTNMQDETKIIVDIQSTENVNVELRDVSGTFYDSTKKVHSVSFIRFTASYDVSVTNPSLFGLGASAVMTGSITAYHIYVVQEWLPWWMP